MTNSNKSSQGPNNKATFRHRDLQRNISSSKIFSLLYGTLILASSPSSLVSPETAILLVFVTQVTQTSNFLQRSDCNCHIYFEPEIHHHVSTFWVFPGFFWIVASSFRNYLNHDFSATQEWWLYCLPTNITTDKSYNTWTGSFQWQKELVLLADSIVSKKESTTQRLFCDWDEGFHLVVPLPCTD